MGARLFGGDRASVDECLYETLIAGELPQLAVAIEIRYWRDAPLGFARRRA